MTNKEVVMTNKEVAEHIEWALKNKDKLHHIKIDKDGKKIPKETK